MAKILFVTHYSELYGANLSLFYMINQIRKINNVLVLVNEKGPFTNKLEEENIEYIISPFFTDMTNSTKRFWYTKVLLKRICNPFFYRMVYMKVIKRGKFDLVHSNSSVTNIGYYISRKLGVPHIWHIREFGKEDYDLVPNISRKKYIRFIESSAVVVAISKHIKDYIKIVAPNSNCICVYNGIRIPPIYKKAANADCMIFCVAGRISDKKNQMDVIKACKCLKDRGYSNYVVRIYGDGRKEYYDCLTEYVRINRLQNSVLFMGYEENLTGEMVNMDVGIVPSKNEAFGRVTIEYMSNYMPVIVSNTGANTELVEDGVEGYLYNLGDYVNLADKMEQLLCDKATVIKMRENARKKAEKFSDITNAKEILTIYERIIEE